MGWAIAAAWVGVKWLIALARLLDGLRIASVAGAGLLICFVVRVQESWRGRNQVLALSHRRHHNDWIAEQHRAALVRAEQTSAAKCRLVATVSHEIRTPLNGILGMALLLRHGGLPAAQAMQIDVVACSAMRSSSGPKVRCVW